MWISIAHMMQSIYYCAYRNSVNNAFLRLFCYVRTDHTMTIKFNASIHRLIGDIFFVTKCIVKWAVI